MGWEIGYDSNWHRDIGYGVPAICDYPGCTTKIDRGLSFVCGEEPCGGDTGCGLFFCDEHLMYEKHGGKLFPQQCERCLEGEEPFTPKPNVEEWTNHKLTHPSWAEWREEQKGKL